MKKHSNSKNKKKSKQKENYTQPSEAVIAVKIDAVTEDFVSFEHAKEYWLLGEWKTLAQIDIRVLKKQDERTYFLLLIMSAYQQLEDKDKVQEYVDLALKWGCSRVEIANILLAGIYNIFGRIIALRKDHKKALTYFEKSISWHGVDVVNKSLKAELRMASQLRQLNIIIFLCYKNKNRSIVNFDVLDKKNKKKTKQLVVLGMHRSGTSCVTGSFHHMGAYFASDKHVMKKSINNPKGFFERVDSMVLNDFLLSESNATWWKVSKLNLNNVSNFNLDEIKEEYRLIISELNNNSLWITKDPRLCLIYPLLKDVFKNPIFIHVYRNPIEVALSLKKRNGFSINFGLALWEFYNKKAFSYSKGMPKVLISYNDLLERSNDIFLSLKAHFYEYFNIRLKIQNNVSSTSFSIDQSLYRNRVFESEMDEWLTSSQLILWEMLEQGMVLNQDCHIPPISKGCMETLTTYELYRGMS